MSTEIKSEAMAAIERLQAIEESAELGPAIEAGFAGLREAHRAGVISPSLRIAAVLAAAAPLIEAQVREQVAREIEAQVTESTEDLSHAIWNDAQRSAANIARGSKP